MLLKSHIKCDLHLSVLNNYYFINFKVFTCVYICYTSQAPSSGRESQMMLNAKGNTVSHVATIPWLAMLQDTSRFKYRDFIVRLKKGNEH